MVELDQGFVYICSMITYIYTLSHPITDEVRYVGKTVNPKQRKHNHTNKARDKGTYKRNWINSLIVQGLRPKFEIIDQVDSNWKFWERYWISQFRTWGFRLCNHGIGGEGLEMANQTSFKKGQIPWNLGIPITEDTKNKIREQRALQTTHKSSPVNRYSLIGKFIDSFNTIREAMSLTNISDTHISAVCKNKRKSAGGYKWEYKIK
jgi:predicted GIY-YIG superfamily endonuclease